MNRIRRLIDRYNHWAFTRDVNYLRRMSGPDDEEPDTDDNQPSWRDRA